MNILYLIDPHSIHDQKWISSFTQDSNYTCFFICRSRHYDEQYIKIFEENYKIQFMGTVDYFSFIKLGRSIRQICTIKSVIKKEKIKLFHIQYAEPNGLWAIFRRYFGVPIMITCRGTDVLETIPNHFAKKDILNRLVSFAYKRAFQLTDWITVTSASQMQSIERFSNITHGISLIRTGVQIHELLTDTSSYFPEEVKKPYILFPRYLKPVYNHEFAIEAIRLLPIKFIREYQMVFIGKDVGDLVYQKELIKALKRIPQINYLLLPKQEQESIWELTKRADLVIMTPKSDGSPVSGMEAIALKKKLILGPLNYDVEIFNNNSTFKLKKWDVMELKELIEFMLTSDIKNDHNNLTSIDYDSNMDAIKAIYKRLTS